MKKRILSLAAMLFCLTTAWAITVDGINYNIMSTVGLTVEVLGVPEYSGEIVIPPSVQYNGKTYSVTSIGNHAFEDCSGLTSITIPSSVTSIGIQAFYGCSGLTSVTIPSSVTSIGNGAFWRCSGLTSVTIPSSVTSIGGSAFEGCSGLTSITIPSSVTSIGYDAFYGCSGLTSITIPSSVTSIGYNTFGDCSGLTSITVEEENPMYDSRDKCNAIIETASNTLLAGCKNTVFPSSVTSIGDFAFKGCSGLTSVTIPSSVTSIGYGAFEGCSGLTSVTIPSSVTSIGIQAFYGCSGLTSVTVEEENPMYDSRDKCNAIIETASNTLLAGCKNTVFPSSVTSIENGAFYGCSGLTSIIIPSSVTSIGDYAFYGCSGLTSITIPSSVTSIGYNTFGDCSGLTSITVEEENPMYDSRDKCNAIIETASNTLLAGCKNTVFPSSVPSIGKGAFYGCSGLTSITIPSSVTSIGQAAFLGCSGLTSVTIPSSVTSIVYATFWRCSGLTSVTIPSSVTSIGDYAFYGCSGLTSVTIPSSVTSIGYYAFYGCSGLTSITIPSSVTSIGYDAFGRCSGLTEVISKIEEPFSVRSDVWYGVDTKEIPLYVPVGTSDKYRATEGWNVFKNIIERSDPTLNDNTVYFSDAEVYQGAQVSLQLKMQNTTDIRAFQFDMRLPDGVSMVEARLGNSRLAEGDGHMLSVQKQTNGATRILCSSIGNDIFLGTEGEVATVILTIDGTLAEDTYEIALKNITLAEAGTSNLFTTEEQHSKLVVKPYVAGDFSGDGKVTPADAIMMLYYYFNVDQNSFNVKAGDLNGDGTITPADAIEALYLYFGAGNNNARAARPAAEEEVRDPE